MLQRYERCASSAATRSPDGRWTTRLVRSDQLWLRKAPLMSSVHPRQNWQGCAEQNTSLGSSLIRKVILRYSLPFNAKTSPLAPRVLGSSLDNRFWNDCEIDARKNHWEFFFKRRRSRVSTTRHVEFENFEKACNLRYTTLPWYFTSTAPAGVAEAYRST